MTNRKVQTIARPGRPQTRSPKLNRDRIVATGLALTKSASLQDVSIVKISRKFGVTPATIHYYLEGRDALTAGIINLFVREILGDWPRLTGAWRHDLDAVASTIYRQYVRYPGIAAYFVAQDRLRVLALAVEQEGGDDLVRFFDRYFEAIGQVGLDARGAATYGVLLLRFIYNAAHSTASHQWPEDQRLLKQHLLQLDRSAFPHFHNVRDEYLEIGGRPAFERGLRLIMAGLEMERRQSVPMET